MASYIMFQGTGSHVGKSILTTALCRIFAREGMRTAPFKAQNMALNSYVTPDGKEMGRAQVAQAEAAGLVPETDMNPVLLKPVGNSRSQVIINGTPVGNMTAREYHLSYCMEAFDAVKSALARMDDTYDILVIEGAGSPAEVNLKDTDIVNMRVAKYLQAPVFLVADIDRGGSLAALVGTLELLEPEERKLVKGLVINKFRGDVSLFEPAVRFLEEKTGKPVIGVVPYIENMGIDEEDSVSLHDMKQQVTHEDVNIAVVMTPKISNFTDFDSLGQEVGIGLYYADTPEKLKDADVIILPGTKNTLEDLQYVRKSGMEAEIFKALKKGAFIVGICGGYQMLGERLCDPHGVESSVQEIYGLGLLQAETTLVNTKLTAQVQCRCVKLRVGDVVIDCSGMRGYEIHAGQTVMKREQVRPFLITSRHGLDCSFEDGAVSENGHVWGTYVHGLFDNDDFRHAFINAVRLHKGLSPLTRGNSYSARKEDNYDRLANIVETHMNMDKIREIIRGER